MIYMIYMIKIIVYTIIVPVEMKGWGSELKTRLFKERKYIIYENRRK